MKKRKTLAIILSLLMIVSILPTEVYASEFTDIPNDWSKTAIENAINNGLLKGNNGKIMPKENLTRAQMATIINRAFGTTEKISLNNYTDVPATAWYYDDMAKAVQMKTFIGNGDKLNPDNNITRQEAFVVLARAFKLSNTNSNAIDDFSDKPLISEWAKNETASLVSAGYVSGSDGKLNPNQYITRAEFAQIMDNLLKNYITISKTYSTNYTGNVMINVPNVTLKNITITGDLIIGDGVGAGEIALDGVNITGRIVIRGGGINSIKIIGNSNIKNIVIARVNEQVKLYSEDETQIDIVTIDGSNDVIVDGNIKTLIIASPNVSITTNNTSIESTIIEGENSNIIVGTNSTLKSITVASDNTTITALENSTIENIVVENIGTNINGAGNVEEVAANANDITVTTAGTKIITAANIAGITVGNTSIIPKDSTSTIFTINSSNTTSTTSKVNVATTKEFYEWKSLNTHVYSMNMSNFDKENIQFKIENNKLLITGKITDPNTNYLRFYLKEDNNSVEKIGFWIPADNCFSTEISLYNIKPNKLYSVELSLYPAEYGMGTFLIFDDLFIEKNDDDIAFVVSPVYLMNNEKFDAVTYEDESYLSSSYDVQTDDEDIIALSKSITNGISSNYDKALAIHDWIADNIYYNFDALYSSNCDYGDTSAKGTLESKTSVCQGYANLTAALFRTSGIPCKVASGFGLGIGTDGWDDENTYGEETNHAWNEAYIDGRWIIIDATWDSGNKYQNSEFIYGGIRNRKYFDTDISWFSLDHKIVNN